MQTDLVGLGEFARRSGLTVKALRYYDRIGLLEPAETSRGTNFRRYRRDQIATARLIAKLRSVGVPIEEIRLALTNPTPVAKPSVRSFLIIGAASKRGPSGSPAICTGSSTWSQKGQTPI